MPTARPSITASIGVVELIGPSTVAANRSPIEAPTPSSAFSSGSPAATREPRVRTSTTSATSRPMPSVSVISGNLEEKSWPPRCASAPAGRACASTSVSVPSASLVSSVMEPWSPSSWIVRRVARSSSETEAGMRSSYGEVTTSTCETSSRSATPSSMAVRIASSLMVPPSGATTITCAEAPLTCGNVAARRSRASWDSVPGMDTWLSRPCCSRPAAPPTRTSATTQAATTNRRARTAQRPSE